jgi:hypothetical protein
MQETTVPSEENIVQTSDKVNETVARVMTVLNRLRFQTTKLKSTNAEAADDGTTLATIADLDQRINAYIDAAEDVLELVISSETLAIEQEQSTDAHSLTESLPPKISELPDMQRGLAAFRLEVETLIDNIDELVAQDMNPALLTRIRSRLLYAGRGLREFSDLRERSEMKWRDRIMTPPIPSQPHQISEEQEKQNPATQKATTDPEASAVPVQNHDHHDNKKQQRNDEFEHETISLVAEGRQEDILPVQQTATATPVPPTPVPPTPVPPTPVAPAPAPVKKPAPRNPLPPLTLAPNPTLTVKSTVTAKNSATSAPAKAQTTLADTATAPPVPPPQPQKPATPQRPIHEHGHLSKPGSEHRRTSKILSRKVLTGITLGLTTIAIIVIGIALVLKYMLPSSQQLPVPTSAIATTDPQTNSTISAPTLDAVDQRFSGLEAHLAEMAQALAEVQQATQEAERAAQTQTSQPEQATASISSTQLENRLKELETHLATIATQLTTIQQNSQADETVTIADATPPPTEPTVVTPTPQTTTGREEKNIAPIVNDTTENSSLTSELGPLQVDSPAIMQSATTPPPVVEQQNVNANSVSSTAIDRTATSSPQAPVQPPPTPTASPRDETGIRLATIQYGVQLAAFSRQENARKFIANENLAAQNPYLFFSDAGGTYAVIIGPFTTRDAAIAKQTQLKSRYEQAWVRRFDVNSQLIR